MTPEQKDRQLLREQARDKRRQGREYYRAYRRQYMREYRLGLRRTGVEIEPLPKKSKP